MSNPHTTSTKTPPKTGGDRVTVELASYVNQAYLDYSMSAVRSRALPDAEDGLKPVQRRILFAMDKLGITPMSKPVKSARVVGDVIGKYHPHGDTAIYDAMVRMAQPFVLRYPLVHGQGNFGTRDGDRPAAMRYTEVRLEPIAQALLDELSLETVDFQNNFDGTLTEPDLLPARLPFLLLNGSDGIAVGFATDFLPHNLREVGAAAKLLLQNPDASLDDVLAVLPAPDFPTGAALISTPEEIRKIYEEGRGSFRLRARWRVERDGRRWRLIFFELPYAVGAERVLEQIQELMEPKPKEKKGRKQPLTPEQLRLKKLFGEVIDDYQNHGGRDEAVRLVITPRDRRMEPEALAHLLLAHTLLEKTVPANFVALDRTGAPRSASIHDWLGQWCGYRLDTMRRRLAHEKRTVDRRLHLLAGRLSILDRIEEVVRVITRSDAPKDDLMAHFGLDSMQADDVLEMRMRQLANLEKTKLSTEQSRLLKEQKRLGRLLGSQAALRKQVIAELDADIARFGDDRRTRLEPAEPAVARKAVHHTAVSEKLAPEPVGLALTERGWIGWKPSKSLDGALASDYKIKAGDQLRQVMFGDRADHLLLLDEAGRGYSLHLMDLPSRADAAPLTTWFDSGSSRFTQAVMARPPHNFLLAGRSGNGFVIQASDWIGRMKAGKAVLTLADDDDRPLPPIATHAATDDACVLALASDGRAVVFPLSDMKRMPKGKGVGIIGMTPGTFLAGLVVVEKNQSVRIEHQSGQEDVLIAPSQWQALVGRRSANKKGKRLVMLTGPVLLTACESN